MNPKDLNNLCANQKNQLFLYVHKNNISSIWRKSYLRLLAETSHHFLRGGNFDICELPLIKIYWIICDGVTSHTMNSFSLFWTIFIISDKKYYFSK